MQTEEDLQNLLNASPTAYTALQQLIADLTDNPNELANILSNISTLQTDVGNKASLMTTVKTSIVSAINELVASIALKFNKSDIVQTDTVNDTTKVASAAVAYVHGIEIDTLNDNLAKHFPSIGIYEALPIPTEEATYFVSSTDPSFPYTWGRLEIRYGSNTAEFIAMFYSTGADNRVYSNVYNSSGWVGWKVLV